MTARRTVTRKPAKPSKRTDADVPDIPEFHALKAKGRCQSDAMAVIDIDRIRPDPDQPRKFFDDLQWLADSLVKHGQLQPITVRYSAMQGCYLIVAGERRYRAAQYAGLATLKCIVIGEERTVLPGHEVLELQLVENIQRQEMLPMEVAAGIKQLMLLKGINATQAAERLGMNKSTVSKLVALLGLPERIRTLVDNKQLNASTAYEISKLADEADQVKLAERAATSHLTRDQVAAEVTRRELVREGGVSIDRVTMEPKAEPKPDPKGCVDLGEFKLTVKGSSIEIESEVVYVQSTLLKPSPVPSVAALADLLESLARKVRAESKKLTYLFDSESKTLVGKNTAECGGTQARPENVMPRAMRAAPINRHRGGYPTCIDCGDETNVLGECGG